MRRKKEKLERVRHEKEWDKYSGFLLFLSVASLLISLISIMKQYYNENATGIYTYLYIVLMGCLTCLCLLFAVRGVRTLIGNNEESYAYRKYLISQLEVVEEKKDRENKVLDADKASHDKNVTKEKCNKETDNRDIIALMLKNNDEITEYFKISKKQARLSFTFSVIACVLGLVAIVIGVYGIIVLKNISVAIISLIGGSVSELISGTIFWVHNKSALQLNHYYNALHDNEKFLSAVNIADKLSAEKRELMLIEIIRCQINKNDSDK